MSIFSKVFGTKNDREIKKLEPRVAAIGALEPHLEKLTDEQIAARVVEIRRQVESAAKGHKKPFDDLDRDDVNAILDPHLHETFGLVREAGKRVLGMRHYDVQLIGGMVLNSGRISEMKTGEGKTLVATLPAVLNSFMPGGVHVVTVNDYLASRDAEWMGRIYRFLGLSVGTVVAHQGESAKREAYQASITYGQNNEFGFDYLRDNMKFSLTDYKQRGHGFAIVDEVDSILIDEARTPLIISGPAEDNAELFRKANGIVPSLRKDEHYTIDEKSRNVLLTEAGVDKVESLLHIDNLYDPVNIDLLHHVSQAVRAHAIYKRDVDYVIEKGEVVIVDDHTGRLMYGRRWSDGLHGAIEAKEGVRIQAENQTLATVTFQNYFRMYRKLSGMTGTADTEAEEFAKIYNLDVILIPTNRPIQRDDQQDLIYKSEQEKVDAIVEDIKEHNEQQQPILVGTVSVEKSEVLAKRLGKLGIPHNVLNAKRHRDEAGIVAQAGRLGGVTIATNMAGRGTDILLGGSPEHMTRQEVAERMGQSDEQVAEFAFLSGRADLINIELLAKRDMKVSKYLEGWLQRQEEERQKREEAAAKGESYTPPSDVPETMEEAREQVFADRMRFYEEAVRHYAELLPKHEEECKKEKQKVLEAGGLRIIGTERHESRRIDNQLRGRAGRQGDPGSSRFYMSLQDDLMRIFGSDKMIRVMEALGMEDGVPIEHKMVSKSIENAQKRVEGMHFDSRKNVLEYDDVMNQQRKSVYGLRRRVLEADPAYQREKLGEKANGKDLGVAMREMMLDLVEEAIVNAVASHCSEKAKPDEWKVPAISDELLALLGVHVDLTPVSKDRDAIMDRCWQETERYYNAKEKSVGGDIMRQLESYLYLQTIDARWKEHLQNMDHLREGIHMRSYAQRDPKQEYKKEGYNLFMTLMTRVRDEVLEKVFKAQVQTKEQSEVERLRQERQRGAQQSQRRQVASHERVAAKAGNGASIARGPALGASSSTMGLGLSPGAGGGLPLPRARANDDDDAGLNRAQRRRMKSQKKKKGGSARPDPGA
jgi:preprotein translocase subunit SecA